MDQYLADAAAAAFRSVRSMGCSDQRHAGQFDGCTDDPSDCLCECHDPQVTT